jgi:subtilisin family serine protease
MAPTKRWIFLLLFCGLSFSGLSQINRYMVFFKDKTGTPYTVSAPLQFLSQKALDRRIKQGIGVVPDDIPVNANYVQGVKGAGAEVFFTTRWMNGLLVQCEPSTLPAIQALPFVDRVEFVAPQAKLVNAGRRGFSLRKRNTGAGIRTQTQLQMLGIPEMHTTYKGEGMTIAVFDGGFQGVNSAAGFQHIFSEGRFNDSASHDFVQNTKNVFRYDDHGTNVLSVIAGKIPDDFTGGAYEANFQLYVTEDASSEFRIEEYNWLFAAERADSAGADIVSSSLGYYDFDNSAMNYTTAQMDGKTAVVTRAAQMLASRGVVVVCSAGNEGNIASWRIIAAPADAEDVIAVANVNSQGVVSSSSSIGPSADGRIKPDLAALGSGVSVITPSGAVSTASGTSLAAPLITSLVAGVWQAYPHLTNKEVIDVIKKTASRANDPNMQIGYGIPNFAAIANYLDRAQQTEIFEVYPNPVTDTITVSPLDPDSVSSCRIEFVSAQGQVIFNDNIEFSWLNNSYKADLTNVSAGLYFIRIWHGARRFVFKIVKL